MNLKVLLTSLPVKSLKALDALFILLIRFYQKTLSILIGRQCRFYPTCSAYGIDVIRKYGIFKGFPRIIWRIARCNPFNHGGYDPVK
ncbi:MAG: membrane protein insertion efficiency factor YidD [Oligoflexia bacterium]|nr:membrane protein insertion efficiency factor YidD [Oligoflexia bacterium]